MNLTYASDRHAKTTAAHCTIRTCKLQQPASPDSVYSEQYLVHCFILWINADTI